jgi:hypothetical protein
MTVFILMWRYGDNSQCGVLRVYEDADRAQDALDLLTTNTDGRVFWLVEAGVMA